MKKVYIPLVLFACLLLGSSNVWAQRQTPLDIALRHIEQQRESWGLTKDDVADLVVSDQYKTTHNGVTHLYFLQRHAGIEVYNGALGVHILPNGQVLHATQRLLPNLAAGVNATTPAIGAYDALLTVLHDLGAGPASPLRLLEQRGNHYYKFAGADVAHNDIVVQLKYQPNRKTNTARLAWDMAIDDKGSPDYWSIRIDAVTGQILDRLNWTVYCDFGGKAHTHAPSDCEDDHPDFQPVREALLAQNLTLNDGASYHVFPLPAESPIHGAREIVLNPADVAASPYGWHDTNGATGPEYRITRGNNVHAYLDEGNDNVSMGDEPNGGDNLVFDFFYSDDVEPEEMKEAAVTQLFYMNNMLHDITFAYGFDEAAGNFQQTNYTGQGDGNDYVRAEAQDGGGTNNANFATPADGTSGRMQMYLWSSSSSDILTINAPLGVERPNLEALPGQFGAPITETALTGQVQVVSDGSNNPTLGCGAIVNDVAGKIALIDRGTCEFGRKSLNAQQAGAIAVIICNVEESPTLVSMGAGAVGAQVTIPAVFMRRSDCQYMRAFIEEGLTITLQQPANSGPNFIDGDFDNGIIAHEYGHGISNRLTGGPQLSGCLGNDEQMGEGWSDFFTLVTTAQPGDQGPRARGIGNYATNRGINGGGIRRQPYSNDFSVNNQVYDDIIGTTAPHPLGEVWAAATWDLYWALVDQYGWDADLINGTAGNNIAIQLVMDGMKLQGCEPGFVSGRDGLLKADTANYGGANSCLIWDVFARRGLGWGASEGDVEDRNDGIMSFEGRPDCTKELKITKSGNDLIEAGDEATITLVVTNHKEGGVTGVMVNDQIPGGMTYVAGSAEGAPVTVNGDQLTFDLGDMASGDVTTITYRLSSDPDARSITQFFDGIEDGDINFFIDVLEGTDIWDIVDFEPYEGQFSWLVPNAPTDNDQLLYMAEEFRVSGSFPVLRFYHNYQTEPAFDAGIVQISTDGGTTWDEVRDLMLRGDYRGKLPFTLFATANLFGFWGNSNGYIATYIDLRPYQGQDIQVRWRFGSDAEEAVLGWYVDNVEFMDLLVYQSEACVSSDQNDLACAAISQEGIFVDSDGLVGVGDEPNADLQQVTVYPNPARDQLNVSVQGASNGDAQLLLFNLNGQLLRQQDFGLTTGVQVTSLPITGLPAGMYLLQIKTENGIHSQKVTVQ